MSTLRIAGLHAAPTHAVAPLRVVPAPQPAPPAPQPPPVHVIELARFGELTPVSRPGGQGRVHRPARVPSPLAPGPVVVKLYHRPPSIAQARLLLEMAAWAGQLDAREREGLQRIAAWPLAVVTNHGLPLGIAMRDLSLRFAVPFVMPSGRSEDVLLALEHLLGNDVYLRMRGLAVALDTDMRARVAERISAALAGLHRHGIVASDIAPSNVLISFADGPSACFIDCDSMVFRGRQALTAVQTADWDMPRSWQEDPHSRASDAYKLGLVILRLFARSHSARELSPHVRHVPPALREPLVRALAPDPRNRPPAGEWQRTLAHLAAQGGLAERYPGPVAGPPPGAPVPGAPAPAPRHVAAARPPGSVAHRVGGAGRAAGGAGKGSARTPTPATVRGALARRGAAPRPLQLALSFGWLVLAAAVAVLLLTRLLSAVLPQTTGSAGAGLTSGAQGAVYSYPYSGGGGGQLPPGYYYARPGGPAGGGR